MSLVKGFESPTQEELQRLWAEGVFVLDTSVLLNLHRYREQVREDVIGALTGIKERLWIPHHVALEYERNRLKVIAKQRSNIRKTKDRITAIPETIRSSLQDTEVFRRHALIDIDELFEELNKVRDRFLEKIDVVHRTVPEVHQNDGVRNRIKSLLSGRIGPAPADQKAVVEMNDRGSLRYSRLQPPGYLDQAKEGGKETATFVYAGIAYESKFGDFYVWEQLKAHASSIKDLPICFVTDDQKEDWWLLLESNGPKRLGPRPELKEEIFRECGVNLFHMYGPDAFLESMNTYRGVGISAESLTEAREVSQEVGRSSLDGMSFQVRAKEGVLQWLTQLHQGEGNVFAVSIFPDLLRMDAENIVRSGYEIVCVSLLDAASVSSRLKAAEEPVKAFLTKFVDSDFRLVFVFSSKEFAGLAMSHVAAFNLEVFGGRLLLDVGYIGPPDSRYYNLATFT